MRILLTLNCVDSRNVLAANYQFPLSAAIYRILHRADAEYAAFLHDVGYGEGLKKYKLFSFSDLSIPFSNNGDRLILSGRQGRMIVCFHLPQAAENFIRGLFMNQQIEVADKKSKVVFQVTQVETIPSGIEHLQGIADILVKPISPLVCGIKNEKGNYVYLSPEDERFVPTFIYSWREKFKSIYGEEECLHVLNDVQVEVVYNKLPPKSRLITIKADTPNETKIRGFVNYSIKLKADVKALELLLNAGACLHSALGMGCVEIIE